MKKLLLVLALALLVAAPALADTASKDGSPVTPVPANPGHGSGTREIFEYNTAGQIDFVPDLGGSSTGWAEYFVTPIENTTGVELVVTELSWPCSGPASPTYGWVVWTGTGGNTPGAPTTAEFHGAMTPEDPDPTSFPPTTYTYVDVSASNVPFAADDIVFFGYDNTGMGGMTSYTGNDTYGWYGGIWDPDVNYGRTAVLQFKADVGGPIPTEDRSWGQVKALYQ